MRIERTYDVGFITKCLTDDAVWSASSDDAPLDKDLVFPPVPADDSVIWVRAGDYGVFMAKKVNHIEFECHTCLLPTARGKAKQIGREVLASFFANTNCLRLTTKIPEFNRLAVRLAEANGFTKYGTNPKSFMKGGVLYATYLYGISKDELPNFNSNTQGDTDMHTTNNNTEGVL